MKKIDELFIFLKKNHAPNKLLQLKSIQSSLFPFSDSKSKIKSLLMDVARTQSSPKLDKLVDLWESFDKYSEPLASAQSLVCFLKQIQNKYTPSEKEHLSEQIFQCLRNVSGFGDKTAALFVKQLILAHITDEELGYPNENLSFLDDGDDLTKLDGVKLYLPVDAVIRHIYINHLGFSADYPPIRLKSDFQSINDFFGCSVNPNIGAEIEAIYWDDLWYWGFITQHSGGESRRTEFNKSKYMSLKTSSCEVLDVISKSADEFIAILGSESL
jgi:hypothetical protein